LAKKRQSKGEGRRGKPRATRWPLVLAYGVAAAIVAAGVLVLVFGGPAPEHGIDVKHGEITQLGVGVMILGVLTGGLTALLQWSASKRK